MVPDPLYMKEGTSLRQDDVAPIIPGFPHPTSPGLVPVPESPPTMADANVQKPLQPSPSKQDLTDDSSSSSNPEILNSGIEKEEKENGVRPDGKRELQEHECYDKLGYCWPRWKRWSYLLAVACVQVSMNFNTSVFPNAVKPLSEAFEISEQHARVGQMIYLVTYSVGCELWAPWSEEFGRWPILQLSMFLINIWQIPAALAPNWGTIVVARGLVCLLIRLSLNHSLIPIAGRYLHGRW